jgi:hypothetical protein
VDTFQDWHRSQLRIYNHCRVLSEDRKNEYLEELARFLGVAVPDQTRGDFLPLTWDQIGEMSANGIDFGSHSCTHPILSRLTQEQLRHEVVASKTEIEARLDKAVELFCYPNGTLEDFNDSVIGMLKRNGYSAAVTAVPGINRRKNQDPFFLRRRTIAGDDQVDIMVRLNPLCG